MSNLNRIVTSNLSGQLAQQLGLTAAPIVAVLVLHQDVGGVSILHISQTLPFLFLSLAAGVWADRASPKIILAGEVVRTLALTSLAFMTASGMLMLSLYS